MFEVLDDERDVAHAVTDWVVDGVDVVGFAGDLFLVGLFAALGDIDGGVEQERADLVAKCDDDFGLDDGDFLMEELEVLPEDFVGEGASVDLGTFAEVGNEDFVVGDLLISAVAEVVVPVGGLLGLDCGKELTIEEADFGEEFPDVFGAKPGGLTTGPGPSTSNVAAGWVHEDETYVGMVFAAAIIDGGQFPGAVLGLELVVGWI